MVRRGAATVDATAVTARHASPRGGDGRPAETRRPGPRRDGKSASTSVLLNGLKVLETFSVAEPAIGVTEIARRVQLHKSTVSRILATLEQAGYVERVTAAGPFRLGLGLIALAGPLLADLDVRRLAGPALERLASSTGETAALTLWSGQAAVVVEQVPSPHQVKHTAPLGTRWESPLSASVQVFVAGLPEAEAWRTVDDILLPGESLVARDRYRATIGEVRQVGWAVNDGQTSEEEVGIAAPVRDHRGAVVAAVVVSAPRFRAAPPIIPVLGQHVIAAADAISARLGYVAGEKPPSEKPPGERLAGGRSAGG